MSQSSAGFIESLILPDYLLFGGAMLLFLLLVVLAVLLRKKTFLSLTLVVLSLLTITLSPTVGYVAMHDYLFKHDCNLTDVKALEFTDALVVRGLLANHSSRDFESCEITAEVYKVAHNPVLDLLFPYSPFKESSILKGPIPKGTATEFKIFVEPFRYTKDYNVSIGASCH
jgi:hypothetical protein